MIEALLIGGAAPLATLPWSGPGPKTLKFGTEDLGYFGKLSQDELFSVKETNDLAGITVGTATPYTPEWMKFILKGKVIYMGTRLFRLSVSWTQIYEAGCVYGTNDNGLYPTAKPTNQLKWKRKEEGNKSWFLKLRIMQGMNNDPFTDATGDSSSSEWDLLVSRVVTGTHPNAGIWEKTDPGGIDTDYYTWTQETAAARLNNALTRGGSRTAAMLKQEGGKTYVAGTHGWRPVFELFDGSSLTIEPAEVVGRLTDGIDAPRSLSATNAGTPAKKPQVVSGAIIPDINPPPTFTAAPANPVIVPRGINGKVDFKPTALSFTTV